VRNLSCPHLGQLRVGDRVDNAEQRRASMCNDDVNGIAEWLGFGEPGKLKKVKEHDRQRHTPRPASLQTIHREAENSERRNWRS
jgi:hypothetical protein